MSHSHFLLPFRDTINYKKIISPTALFITVIFSIIVALLTDNILNISIIYLVSLVFFLLNKASFFKTMRLLMGVTVIIFFLGLPSFFLSIGEVFYQFSVGKTDIFIYSGGMNRAFLIWIRGLTSASTITLYSTCVTLQEFIESMRSLFIPNIIVTIILLMMRYVPMFYKEGQDIRIAQQMRGLAFASRNPKFKAVAALIGGTIIKSIKRGGEVYEAMVLRGFENQEIIKRGKITMLDPLVLLLLTVIQSFISGGIIQLCIMK